MTLGENPQPITPADLYWLAGLIEGEGCWLAKSYPRKKAGKVVGRIKAIRLLVWMTDLDVVQKAHRLLGEHTPIAIRPAHGNRQESYGLRVHGQRAVEWAMTLYSLMGTRRKAQIRKLLELWKS